MGYHLSTKGYRFLDPISGKLLYFFLIPRHVVFSESCFPFTLQPGASTSLPAITSFFSSTPACPSPIPSSSRTLSPPTLMSSPHIASPHSLPPSLVPLFAPPALAISIQSTYIHFPLPSLSSSVPALSSSAPVPVISTNAHPIVTRSKVTAPVCHCAYTSPIDLVITEPKTATQALHSFIWFAARIEEFKALKKQGTWDLVSLPATKTTIGCKWVFRIKKNSDGTIATYKTRLVAKSYLQQGVDYQETFSPVVKEPTIKILVFSSKGWRELFSLPLNEVEVM